MQDNDTLGSTVCHVEAVRSHLQEILSSPTFRDSKVPSQFLSFVVEKTLAGKQEEIKEYTVAVEALGRPKNFEPSANPYVRNAATTVRNKLLQYYAKEGRASSTRIDIPTGGYVPVFSDSSPKCNDEPIPSAMSISTTRRKILAWGIPSASVGGLGVLWKLSFSLGSVHSAPSDKDEVRRVVLESQVYELRTIYTNPKAFNREMLNKFWVPVNSGGQAALNIEASVQKQLKRKLRYGTESKVEMFDFIDVSILPPGDYAEVRTRERWYAPVYREDTGRAFDKPPFLGPYQVDYTLRKINGRWLVQWTSTPYAQ